MSEAQEQKAVIEWCNWNSNRFEELKWIYAVPNGGYRHPAEAKKLKATGTKRGVPDLFLPVARNGKHGLYIEMKYGKNRLQPVQHKWYWALIDQGYEVKVCYSADEAIAVIKEYLGVK